MLIMSFETLRHPPGLAMLLRTAMGSLRRHLWSSSCIFSTLAGLRAHKQPLRDEFPFLFSTFSKHLFRERLWRTEFFHPSGAVWTQKGYRVNAENVLKRVKEAVLEPCNVMSDYFMLQSESYPVGDLKSFSRWQFWKGKVSRKWLLHKIKVLQSCQQLCVATWAHQSFKLYATMLTVTSSWWMRTSSLAAALTDWLNVFQCLFVKFYNILV